MKAIETCLPDLKYAVYRECTSSWKMKANVLRSCDISYLVDGAARYIINGESYCLKAGDLLCLPEGSCREAATFHNNLMHCYAVDFRLRNLEGAVVQMPLPLLNHVGYRKDLIKLFEEINYTWSVKHPGFRIKGAGLLMLLFQRIIILTNKIVLNDSDSRIERIKRYITEHYFESIPISKMSEIARLNPFYFKTLFKQETGITPHIYLIQTRVKAAEELLRSGNYKVADVSRLCGYADVYHFSKQFKKILGCSPSACIPNRSSLL